MYSRLSPKSVKAAMYFCFWKDSTSDCMHRERMFVVLECVPTIIKMKDIPSFPTSIGFSTIFVLQYVARVERSLERSYCIFKVLETFVCKSVYHVSQSAEFSSLIGWHGSWRNALSLPPLYPPPLISSVHTNTHTNTCTPSPPYLLPLELV